MPRPTQAIVDLGAIRHNLGVVRRLVGTHPRLLVPVKADAYGHGAVPVARLCEQAGADLLGIATVEEGAALRQAGIGLPLVLLGSILPAEATEVVRHGLTASLGDTAVAATLAAAAREAQTRVPVCIEVDTGMGRAGVHPWQRAAEFILDVHRRPEFLLQAVFSHFPGADEPDRSFAREQLRRLADVRAQVEAAGGQVPLWSMANSSAICDLPEAHLDLVRPGIMTYGYRPSPECRSADQLRPAMTLRSAIGFLKRANRGTPIGYGSTYRVPQDDSVVATIPIGYADGYRRALSNRAPVLVGGRRYLVSGRVSMDQTTVDLGPGAKAAVGDEVVLIGRQQGACVSVEEIASLLGTISYEVTCGIGARVPRVWVDRDAEGGTPPAKG
jgi:alanine racemase